MWLLPVEVVGACADLEMQFCDAQIHLGVAHEREQSACLHARLVAVLWL